MRNVNLTKPFGEDMFKTLVFAFFVSAFAFSSITFAANTAVSAPVPNTTYSQPGDRHGQVHFGVGSGAFNLGFDYLTKDSENVESGGYILYLKDKDKAFGGFNSTVRFGMFAAGAVVKIHIPVDAWDLYVAPGFGLAVLNYVDSTTNDPDASKTTVGPLFRAGVLRKASERISLGIEQGFVYNMFNSDLPDGPLAFANGTMRFIF
jgi:hypothetical protein